MDGHEGGGAVGQMQGLSISFEMLRLFGAALALPPDVPHRSPPARPASPALTAG
jgi:hypothetical protein